MGRAKEFKKRIIPDGQDHGCRKSRDERAVPNPVKKKQVLVVISGKIVTVVYNLVKKQTEFKAELVLGEFRKNQIGSLASQTCRSSGDKGNFSISPGWVLGLVRL